ncbi:hypothetical protein AB0L70_17280 [Kribbella sp. NPDC051952]|uniref:hypothetical protein n=1 Tax=Kribbella sp. NPDC051952 TaxID=3154851 RepID=UPI0034439A54
MTQYDEVSAKFLALADELLPGRVRGLYLTGSIPLDDFRPGRSDIDGVVVVDTPVTEDEVRPLHANLPSRPYFDVTYLTAAELAVAPDPGAPLVCTVDGEFKVGGASPVLWAELARSSLAVREVPGLTVVDDHQALVDYTRDNLVSYWQPLLDQVDKHFADLPRDQVIDAWIIPWCVLGVPRLHALLATGNIVSKTAAGEHGAVTFPAYGELCRRAIEHRGGAEVVFTAADAVEAVAFGRAVVASAAGL